jgi:hypothetical protein
MKTNTIIDHPPNIMNGAEAEETAESQANSIDDRFVQHHIKGSCSWSTILIKKNTIFCIKLFSHNNFYSFQSNHRSEDHSRSHHNHISHSQNSHSSSQSRYQSHQRKSYESGQMHRRSSQYEGLKDNTKFLSFPFQISTYFSS